MRNHRRRKSHTLMILLVAVALIAGSVLIKLYIQRENDITLTAEGYTLLKTVDVGSRASLKVSSKDPIEKINSTLSGKYIEVRHLPEIDDSETEIVCIVNPMYKTDDGSKVDDYATTVYHEETENGPITYGESIYIINKRTIGFWDAKSGDIWIGKKVGHKIDTSIFEDLIKKENLQ